jgi:DNA polymerase III epsilon subunit-like protein
VGRIVYICVDCEASGPVPPLYNLLSIGATAVREEADRHELGESFYVELKPIFPGFDKAALAVCGLDVGWLGRAGTPPRDALLALSGWVRGQAAGASERPVFVGHNAVFDWAYIAYYYAHHGLDNPFGYKALDTKSLAMGRLGIAWSETSKESLERRLGLPPQDPARVHRADYDAYYQARILKALLELPGAGARAGR